MSNRPDADIAVAEGQSLGLPLGFGGPHAAYLAAGEECRRLIPGRVVGVARRQIALREHPPVGLVEERAIEVGRAGAPRAQDRARAGRQRVQAQIAAGARWHDQLEVAVDEDQQATQVDESLGVERRRGGGYWQQQGDGQRY